MRALSINQPYASLLALGVKRVENRGKRTRHRGPLLIHATQKYDGGMFPDPAAPPPEQCPQGAVVAVADVVDCVRARFFAGTYWFEPADLERHPWLAEHRHACGPWCWVLDNVRPLPQPIPCKGAQSIWKAPPGVVRKVQAALHAGLAPVVPVPAPRRAPAAADAATWERAGVPAPARAWRTLQLACWSIEDQRHDPADYGQCGVLFTPFDQELQILQDVRTGQYAVACTPESPEGAVEVRTLPRTGTTGLRAALVLAADWLEEILAAGGRAPTPAPR